MVHDPYHVAHIAATILSSRDQPEAHHIKAAVGAARAVLDEAHRRAEEDSVAAETAKSTVETEAPETGKAQ